MPTACTSCSDVVAYNVLNHFTFRYFIKEGCVSEAGTHDELLALRGGYYEYVQLQALSKD